MSFKSSYSQNSTFIKCSQHWKNKYIEGWEGTIEGASTFFGSAMDAAVTAMLEKQTNWLPVFYDKWEFQANYGKATKIFDNPNISYSHKDLDTDLLEAKDFPLIETWAKELNLLNQTAVSTPESLISLIKQNARDKSNPYKKYTDEQFKFFNRCSWLGLKRKGKILLNAFHEQFYPKIKTVISTQQRSKLEDNMTGDSMVGVIDMVLELHDYPTPIIFDLKTASMAYDQDQIDVSPQLTLYAAMEGRKYNTDLVGYIVLSKQIYKEETAFCTTCGNKKTSRHATCDAKNADGSRCGGTWQHSKIPKPMVQVMVEKKSQEQIDDLLMDSSNIILAMKNQITYKNYDTCSNWFGSPCVYKDLCHKKDSSKLRKRK